MFDTRVIILKFWKVYFSNMCMGRKIKKEREEEGERERKKCTLFRTLNNFFHELDSSFILRPWVRRNFQIQLTQVHASQWHGGEQPFFIEWNKVHIRISQGEISKYTYSGSPIFSLHFCHTFRVGFHCK